MDYASLTTIPTRLEKAKRVIESIRNQTLPFKKIFLNVCEEDFPGRKIDIQPDDKIVITWTNENIRNFKKLIPTLETLKNENSNDYIFIFDDDFELKPEYHEYFRDAIEFFGDDKLYTIRYNELSKKITRPDATQCSAAASAFKLTDALGMLSYFNGLDTSESFNFEDELFYCCFFKKINKEVVILNKTFEDLLIDLGNTDSTMKTRYFKNFIGGNPCAPRILSNYEVVRKTFNLNPPNYLMKVINDYRSELRIINPNKLVFTEVEAMILENYYSELNSDETILLNANDMSIEEVEDLKRIYGKLIIYNFEQLSDSSKWWNPNYSTILNNAYVVWDYNKENVEFLKHKNIKALYRPVKHCTKLKKSWNNIHKDIGVLFYGNISERRSLILNNIAKKLTGVCGLRVVQNVYGSKLEELIARSKIVLNIHAFEGYKNQEVVRMMLPLHNDITVLSEHSTNDEYVKELGGNCYFSDWSDMAENIKFILENDLK